MQIHASTSSVKQVYTDLAWIGIVALAGIFVLKYMFDVPRFVPHMTGGAVTLLTAPGSFSVVFADER